VREKERGKKESKSENNVKNLWKIGFNHQQQQGERRRNKKLSCLPQGAGFLPQGY
jgi:hypothetical protein